MSRVDHAYTISVLAQMMQDMPKSSSYERIVLLAVSIDDDVKMRQLSSSIGVTPGALTSVIDRLEDQALVQRVADPEDRRITLIRITPNGTKMVAQAERRAKEEKAA